VLDVTYHVSQYQNIIAELKGEIERLKDKMNTEPVRSSLPAKIATSALIDLSVDSRTILIGTNQT